MCKCVDLPMQEILISLFFGNIYWFFGILLLSNCCAYLHEVFIIFWRAVLFISSQITHRSLVLHFNRLLKPDRLESASQN